MAGLALGTRLVSEIQVPPPADALRQGRDLHAKVLRFAPVLRSAHQDALATLTVLRRSRVLRPASSEQRAANEESIRSLEARVRLLADLEKDRKMLVDACGAYNQALMADGASIPRDVFEGHVRRQTWFANLVEQVVGRSGARSA